MWQKKIALFIVPLISPFPFSIWSWIKEFLFCCSLSQGIVQREWSCLLIGAYYECRWAVRREVLREVEIKSDLSWILLPALNVDDVRKIMAVNEFGGQQVKRKLNKVWSENCQLHKHKRSQWRTFLES